MSPLVILLVVTVGVVLAAPVFKPLETKVMPVPALVTSVSVQTFTAVLTLNVTVIVVPVVKAPAFWEVVNTAPSKPALAAPGS
jgi:uncharacterized membrane protein YGL010W